MCNDDKGNETVSSPIHVLEPTWAIAKYNYKSNEVNVEARMGSITASIPLDLLDLIFEIQKVLLDPLIVPSADKPLTRCSKFSLIWTSKKENDNISITNM